MKRIFKDILGGFFVILPMLIFVCPLITDVRRELNKVNFEPTRIEIIARPQYGYNPSYCEAEYHELAVLKTVAYCPCEKCCGWNTGITASGSIAKQGRTVAANLELYPIGTKIIIDGKEYIVEDTGNLSDYLLDIYFDSHEEALKYGAQWKTVEIIRQGD